MEANDPVVLRELAISFRMLAKDAKQRSEFLRLMALAEECDARAAAHEASGGGDKGK